MTGSNRRPPACKAGALPAELTARRVERSGFVEREGRPKAAGSHRGQELHRREEEIWGRRRQAPGRAGDRLERVHRPGRTGERVAQESGLDGSGALAVTPAPLSFKAWLLLLHRAATDPEVRAEPYEEQLIDAGLFGNRDSDGNALPGVIYDVRPAGTREVDVRKKLDYGDRLHDLIPDLTPVVRALQLSGNVRRLRARRAPYPVLRGGLRSRAGSERAS